MLFRYWGAVWRVRVGEVQAVRARACWKINAAVTTRVVKHAKHPLIVLPVLFVLVFTLLHRLYMLVICRPRFIAMSEAFFLPCPRDT